MSKATATQATEIIHEATGWRVFGKGTNKVFTVAMAPGTHPLKAGDRIKAVSSAGKTTIGTVIGLHKVADDQSPCYTLQPDRKGAAQIQADRIAEAQSVIAYYSSDQGAETARKIAERQARIMADRQAKQTSLTIAAVDAPTVQQSLASMIAELIKAGVTVELAVATATAALAAPTAPTTPVITSSKAPTVKPPTAPKQNRAVCMACGKLDVLKAHSVHPEAKVCTTCHVADGDTIAARVARQAIREAAGKAGK